uniref:DUF4795 domain-containing protein n=1 Tax=Anopheles albimanus TaxID=7167 RepID=A0A182F4Y0_ANOAL
MAEASDPATINEILKQLKEQLGAAFVSPSGSRIVNIFELENLLSTLINLHERYAACNVADCLAMLEGCKNHLELLREEIVSLKTRCQAQHEQSLQFASSLDRMVERFAGHDPKLSKLETDTHCLGMLISDYEVEFEKIKKHVERQDGKLREIEWTFQRMDRERDSAKGELRGFTEQLNDLAAVKADKVYVQMELNLRALITDMERRVPFDQHNATIHDMSRTLTQLQEQFNEVDENLKTIQYQLLKSLSDKASALDLNEIRRQLAGLSCRWQKMEKSMLIPSGQSVKTNPIEMREQIY